eukprot:jgi/Mesvir1/19345/Mv10400-RA.2
MGGVGYNYKPLRLAHCGRTYARKAYARANVEAALEFIASAVAANYDCIITTLPSDRYIEPLLAAHAIGIPIYIVGGTSQQAMEGLRASITTEDSISASITRLGMDEDDAARKLAQRLMGIGIRTVHCLLTDSANVAYAERCRSMAREMARLGQTSFTRPVGPLSFLLEQLIADILLEPRAAPMNQTAFVLMEDNLYGLFKDVAHGTAAESAHVVSYESSLAALTDIAIGRPVTLVDQNYYTQGYMAVALASVELLTMQAVSSDVTTGPVFVSLDTVTNADFVREACREDGFPICGAPGVPHVTSGGCPCFDRSQARVGVLSSLPFRQPEAYNFYEGLLRAQKDIPGSSFHWDPAPVMNDPNQPSRYMAMINDTDMSAAISLDLMFATRNPALYQAIRMLGFSFRNEIFNLTRSDLVMETGDEIFVPFDGFVEPPLVARAFYLGHLRDELLSPANLLESTAAVLYVGASAAAAGWDLGRYARQQLGSRHMLVNQANLHLPYGWDLALGTTLGFQNISLNASSPPVHPSAFPDVAAFRWPATGQEAARSGVYQVFNQSAQLTSLLVNGPLSIIAPQPSLAGTSPFVTVETMAGVPPTLGRQYLTPLLERLYRSDYRMDTVEIQALDTHMGPWALEALQTVSQDWGQPVQLLTHRCTASEFQAMANASFYPGGALLAACLDEQHYLTSYVAFTAAVLRQQTGEQLLNEVRTGRLVRRAAAISNNSQFKRRAACESFADKSGFLAGVHGMYFPVCDTWASTPTHPGCVANATGSPSAPMLCSGHGRCMFPTAADNAASNTTLLPWVGRCLCDAGYAGHLCADLAASGGDGMDLTPLTIVLSTVLPVVFGAVLCFALWVLGGRRLLAQRVKAHLRYPPTGSSSITAVLTDIEGSTGLWEWDSNVMNQSLQIHHKVLRTLLPKFHGYESNTEGDSFEIVFHNACDALGWAMAVQMALLYPEQLLAGTRPAAEAQAYAWPAALFSQPNAAEVLVNGTAIYRGLRVRMGIHTGVPASSYVHTNGRRCYKGMVMDIAKAISDAPSVGGQVLMSMDAWQSLGVQQPSSTALQVFNLGDHVLCPHLPPVQLMQVLPAPLGRRVPFRPLKTSQALSPSFFEAPGCQDYGSGMLPTEAVTLMFIFVGGAKVLRDNPGYIFSKQLAVDFVRQLLGEFHGYECEEKEGNFLLAFHTPVQAVVFSARLQEGLMDLPWPDELLSEEVASEVIQTIVPGAQGSQRRGIIDGAGRRDLNPKKDLTVFRGLRMQVGMYMGVPTDVSPHATTGRAAYYGPVINRTARVAAMAASGQTLCNAELHQEVVGKEGTAGLVFVDLGEFPVKGLKMPMHIIQVSSPRTATRLFPRTRGVWKSGSKPSLLSSESRRVNRESMDQPPSPTAADDMLRLRMGCDVGSARASPSVLEHVLPGHGESLVSRIASPRRISDQSSGRRRSRQNSFSTSPHATAKDKERDFEHILTALAKKETMYHELLRIIDEKEAHIAELTAALEAKLAERKGRAGNEMMHLVVEEEGGERQDFSMPAPGPPDRVQHPPPIGSDNAV